MPNVRWDLVGLSFQAFFAPSVVIVGYHWWMQRVDWPTYTWLVPIGLAVALMVVIFKMLQARL